MTKVKRETKIGIIAATIITLLMAILLGVGIAAAESSNSAYDGIQVLKVTSKDHGETLKKMDQILNLKTTSVKAITSGQNVLIMYLVGDKAELDAICKSLPNCKAG